MKVLFTAIGRRVQLIKHFKEYHRIIGVDIEELVPAKYFVDAFYKVPKWNEEDYLDVLLSICEKERVDMIIPLFEKEFISLCENRKKFNEIGTALILSDKKIIETFNDKWKSYKFFMSNNIDTPMTYSKQELKDCNFPLIIKPTDGAGSKNVFKIKDEKELNFFIDYIENPIIQEFVEGTEYTIDVLCDLDGNVISIVPRQRIEVRAGEVSKGRTVKDMAIIERTLELCNKLKIDENIKPIGPLTIQCIVDLKGNIKFIEVNPRFGGGVPLSFEAGVAYAELLRKMVKGEEILPIIGEFKELTMLRYDEAVYI
ncbi:ATP-grasp domain-containing protein [Tepidimicrobium xylanilyticum]|uniref:Carbamoyl-phosphate synthase large subunit n=1 Tax=Tepidimicrobium xylanilyticum TaxID=1123352 RepID=A0A1H2QRM9_9FIRM|nr:ATP-grasp domain-containing protein [Tepidimicrobium xylanilyticum]SDW09822.1 carbamoyl-phosphate synthase large subunit [Tepidimicrobium xylanilyticum]